MKKRNILILLIVPFLWSCQSESETKKETAAETKPVARVVPQSPVRQALIEKVPTELVCMINDRFMGSPQIPVEVQGKIYYGCCEGCKKKLAEIPETRSARDPITGKMVDKATAVIGKKADGTVLYFGSEENFSRFVNAHR